VVNRFPRDLPSEAWEAARALQARGGDSAPAAGELLRMLDARREAQSEALEILGGATKDTLHVRPLILREQMEDPTALGVAAWLEGEGAA
jgi:arsenite/tail-anchored protein-transporting ATPase